MKAYLSRWVCQGVDDNLSRFRNEALGAAEDGAGLVVFPELFLTGYSLPLNTERALCLRCHSFLDYPNTARAEMPAIKDRMHKRRRDCVECHNPHAPAFPSRKPVHQPRDRFMSHGGGEHH